jgi:peptidoglycan hydrolase-like protein with peptidoglycan-binding domain
MAACNLTTDMLIANGGTVTLPYTATLFSTTLMNGQPARNCAYADIPQTGQHAPGGPGGKTCVSIPLSSVIDDPVGPVGPVGPFDPGILTGPVLNSDVFVPTPFKPSLSVAKFQTEACVANRNTQRYTCGFRLGVTNSGPGAFSGPMVLTDTFTSSGGQAVTVLSGGGWSCANPVNGAISCENASLTLAPGATSNIDLSMQVQGLVRGGSFQNCAALGIPDDRRQRVAAIQQVMNARGLNAGKVDGLLGRRTYAALAELQRSLGLPVSQSFDDGLFRALGLVLQEPGKQSCITVDLPRMPPAPLQCDAATTVPRGESCACRYDNMIQRNTASCQCRAGYVFTADRGCTPAPKPDPTPTPRPTPDTPRPAPDTPSQPRCENGLPRVNGKCLSIQIMPGGGGDGPAGADGCRIMVGGVCIK